MCRVAGGHSGGVTSDMGQLVGDTVLEDAPERGLGSWGVWGTSGKRGSRKPRAQGPSLARGRQGGRGWESECRVQLGARKALVPALGRKQ